MAKLKLTEFQARALTFIQRNGPVDAGYFAVALWTESPAWSSPLRAKALKRTAGGYLAKLHKKGLCDYSVARHGDEAEVKYIISRKGKDLLAREAPKTP